MFSYVRLNKNCRDVRIDSYSEINARQLTRFRGEHLWVLRQRDRVQIYYAEEALVFVLQRDPVAQRAEIISQVNVAGGLRAAKNSFKHQAYPKILINAGYIE